jgi:hypothetical protein
MWISASSLPMLREPEWSMIHTFSAVSRHSSMKWLPPPRVPSCPRAFLKRPCTFSVSSGNSSQSEAAAGTVTGSSCAAKPTGIEPSMSSRIDRRLSGRSLAVRFVFTAPIPQPMSTPTAAGETAPFIAITDPTVAPLPKWTSGMAATW